ncbi:MAG TPA: ADOP family duplicated permease [Longimicrobiales bacterium]|nr:ADOP family duplicated permease [Longimicrobiales bacterium]
MNLTEAWNRVRDRLRRDRLASELDEELRFHRAMLERDEREGGASAEEAQRLARVAFGSATYHKERARDLWSLGWVDDVLQDVRYAGRGLRARPGFTLAVVLTLALGIGANAAIFSIVDRLLFRPPPMLAHPALTHRIYVAQSDRGREGVWPGISYARCLDFTRWTTSFARTAEFSWAKLAVGVGDDAREMPVAAVSASFFGFFDAPPALGRYFTTREDTVPSGTPVVVLSHALWEVRFGGRTDALGATVQIGPTMYTVIGVAPAGFAGLWPTQPPAAYIPITSYAATSGFRSSPGDGWWQTYHWNFAQMLAERRPGVTVAQAHADLTNAYRRSYAAQRAMSPDVAPIEVARPRAIVASVLAERGPNETRVGKVARLVAAMAVVVLLIACANVANLLLAGALRRRREIAVRLALGVSRARLFSQLLSESLLFALLGGAAGVVVAQWSGGLLRSLFLPEDATTTVLGDPRTLTFAGAAALIAALLTGLAPVWQSRRADLTQDLKAGAREGTYHRSRTRAVLLIVQGAFSVVLLVAAGLFVRSLQHVRELRLGYDVDPVLVVELNMRGVKLDGAHAVALRQRLLERAQDLPGVQHAALHTSIPFWRTLGREGLGVDLRVAGIDSVDLLGEFYLDAVTPDYFATMGTRILRGRGIGEQDVAGAPAAMVVSEAMAKVLWSGKDPIGQCVRVIEYGTTGKEPPCTYVVGVAEDIKSQSLSDDEGFYYYLSSAQFHPQQTGLFVRTHGDAAGQAEAIRRALQPLMPGASYITVTPFADVIGGTMRSWKLGATVFGAFGALALLLAAIGLYSVIAYNVVQRAHELGVRIALGAQVGDVLGLVVGQGVRLGLVGVVIGGTIAFSAARWLKPLLFQESARDPAVYALVAAVLLAVAVVASYVPARRAARVDPNVALRAE